MVEAYLRQSSLAHLGLQGRAEAARGAAGVGLAEAPLRAIVDVRLRREAAAGFSALETEFGFALPQEPNTTAGKDGVTGLWLGPDEWWLIAPGTDPTASAALAARARKATAGQFGAVTEVGDSRTCLRVSGPKAGAVLQKGTPLDLHPRGFAPGRCAQSQLAKASVVLHRLDGAPDDDPVFEVYVLRSFAEYLWLWLEDAAGEYGLAVLEG